MESIEVPKKKRGENWSSEEKRVLRELIAESAHILENKCTKTEVNILKQQEYNNITEKLFMITGKERAPEEIKLCWKRMKLAAKATDSDLDLSGSLDTESNKPNPNITVKPLQEMKKKNKVNNQVQNRNVAGSEQIVSSNIEFKKRQLEMLEEEHEFNIRIAQLKVRKLELEIEILENNKNFENE